LSDRSGCEKIATEAVAAAIIVALVRVAIFRTPHKKGARTKTSCIKLYGPLHDIDLDQTNWGSRPGSVYESDDGVVHFAGWIPFAQNADSRSAVLAPAREDNVAGRGVVAGNLIARSSAGPEQLAEAVE
jgi:hypothetical protein